MTQPPTSPLPGAPGPDSGIAGHPTGPDHAGDTGPHAGDRELHAALAQMGTMLDETFDDGARTMLEAVEHTFVEGWDDIRRLNPEQLAGLFEQMKKMIGPVTELSRVLADFRRHRHHQGQQQQEGPRA